ncbi:MAG: SDR family oxidoreductase [Lewinellaceae bacterium]|nr:SDR family oxidoreductase [Lewinellaceae bacterium]
MKVLIVGSTGQLGFTIAQKLSQTSHQVLAFHRSSSDTSALKKLPAITLVQGDLLEPDTLKPALKDVDVVISTANAAVPSRKEDNFKNDVLGHRNLIQAAKEAGVKQFIFTSAISFGQFDRSIPLFRSKRQTEADLAASGIPYTVFQPSNFMDIYFAFFGTELPLQGVPVASLKRPFKFMNSFFDGVRNDMKEKDTFDVIGKGDQPTSFISVDNVADFHVQAIDHPGAINRFVPIGGPEQLTALDVKAIFEEVYGKELKVKSTPAAMIGLMSKVMSPFNINAANILATQYAGTKIPGIVPNAQEAADEFGVQLTSAHAFLMEKAGRVELV